MSHCCLEAYILSQVTCVLLMMQLLMVVVNAVRYTFLRSYVGHWSEMLLILQVSPQHCMRITTTVIKKVKVAHTRLLSVGFWS